MKSFGADLGREEARITAIKCVSESHSIMNQILHWTL